ncbi:protein JTB [Dendrobates tinctorius]|uniref:protein JTB n=1 Tax=Dendrobates tinctorius TaxID=92724 RepID=UPI003CC97512
METAGCVLRGVFLLSFHSLVLSFPAQEEQSPLQRDPPAVSTLCWQTEEYTIFRECYSCNQFEAKTLGQCSITGFIEQVSCTTSEKSEYKSDLLDGKRLLEAQFVSLGRSRRSIVHQSP